MLNQGFFLFECLLTGLACREKKTSLAVEYAWAAAREAAFTAVVIS